MGSEVLKSWTAGRRRKSLFLTPSAVRLLLAIILACRTHTHYDWPHIYATSWKNEDCTGVWFCSLLWCPTWQKI